MKVKCVYVIQNRKYTGGTVQEKKAWNTVRVISYQLYLYINVISVLCNPNGTLFQTCLILHVWLKSIILVFANILIQTHFFLFFLQFLLVNMPSIINFTHLSRTGVVIHKVHRFTFNTKNNPIHYTMVVFCIKCAPVTKCQK